MGFEQGVMLLNTVLTVRAHQPIPTGASAGRSSPTRQSEFWPGRIARWYLYSGKTAQMKKPMLPIRSNRY